MTDATITMYASAIGNMNFQPSDMSWSYRNRGSVQRIQMKTKMKNSVFTMKIAIDNSSMKNATPVVLSCVVNGMSQPPKNSVAISALDVAMFAYSEIGNIENFIALYSVWYPAMSSDSASGRSNGNRFVSANAATMKMKNAIVRLTTFHPPYACCVMIAPRVTFPASSSTGIVESPSEIS